MSAEQGDLFAYRREATFRPPRPTARTADPTESKLAAQSIEPANQLLVVAIRSTLKRAGRAMTQHELAASIVDEYDGRWQADSVRSCCARAGLVKVGEKRVGKRSYGLYAVPTEAQRAAS